MLPCPLFSGIGDYIKVVTRFSRRRVGQSTELTVRLTRAAVGAGSAGPSTPSAVPPFVGLREAEFTAMAGLSRSVDGFWIWWMRSATAGCGEEACGGDGPDE